jgi:hypothetical protein
MGNGDRWMILGEEQQGKRMEKDPNGRDGFVVLFVYGEHRVLAVKAQRRAEE